MEQHSKSTTNTTNDDDHFFDSHDEFPFYDCFGTSEPDESISQSSSISQLDPIESNAGASITSPAVPSSSGFRRRHSFSQHIRSDSKYCNPNSEVTFDLSDTSSVSATSRLPREGKYKFARSLTENVRNSERPDLLEAPICSGGTDYGLKEEIQENSTVTTASGGINDEFVSLDSNSGVADESSWKFLFHLAGLLIKAIRFQLSFLVTVFTFPIRLLYCSYMFVIDPFGVVKRVREYLMRKLFRIIRDYVARFIYEWLKERNSFWKLALWFGWGLLWSVYICFILVCLLIIAFVVSGFMMRFLVEEPIQMKETLNFDYTKNSPVAFVPLISCQAVSCGENCKENVGIGKLGTPRVIPSNNNFRVTVSLTLPESDYNRNLGMFQVRVDHFSVHGEPLGSLSHPCMLQFKSEPIRLLLTFLKIAPLLAEYVSESQTININFRGFTEVNTPTACLRVIVEQRAEFTPGAGIPEIYDASLTLESELPLLKRILWNWKKMVLVWISLTMFTIEFLLVLLCFRPFVIPRVRPRGSGSADNGAPQNNPPVQR